MTDESRKPRGILSLALPMIIGNLLSSIVGFASIKAVGGIGLDAVAAVLSAERALITLQCILILVNGATTALVAQHWGAGQREGAVQSIKTSLIAIVVVSLLLTALTYALADHIIGLFGLQPEVAEEAASFLRVVSLFNLPYGVCGVMAAALRAAGDAYAPLWIFGLANVLNVGLLYALVGGLGPIPAMGVEGAALANGLSFTAAALAFIIPWLAGKFVVPAQGGSYGHLALVRPLIRIGLPASLEQLLFHAGLFAMVFIIARFGTDAVAAYGVGVNLVAFSYVFGTGFAVASATMVGQAIGAGDAALARRSAWRSALYAAICMSVLGVLILALGRPISAFLGLAGAVTEILMSFLVVLAIIQPLMALEFALSGALRGAGDTRTTMLITFAGLFGGRLLLALTLHQLGFSVAWIFTALILDYAIKSTLYVVRLRSDGWTKPIISRLASAR